MQRYYNNPKISVVKQVKEEFSSITEGHLDLQESLKAHVHSNILGLSLKQSVLVEDPKSVRSRPFSQTVGEYRNYQSLKHSVNTHFRRDRKDYKVS